MKVRHLLLVALCFVLQLSARADAQTDRWIARARASVGSETTLNNVRSIHFMGTLETTAQVPAEGDATRLTTETVRLALDIVFQKPYQQRMTLRSDQVVETTALDEYDGWVRRTPAAEPAKWQISLLDTQQVKRLRANTWENLAFFRGIEKRGGTVAFVGDATVDGRECGKLVFTHADNIVFTRYFAKDSGALVKTETEAGGEIREEGELIVQGLRFPRKLINKAPNGQVSVITFDRITINEDFPPDTFAVPTLLPSN